MAPAGCWAALCSAPCRGYVRGRGNVVPGTAWPKNHTASLRASQNTAGRWSTKDLGLRGVPTGQGWCRGAQSNAAGSLAWREASGLEWEGSREGAGP